MKDEEAWRLDELREEARYRRERLELYRAKMYGGRAHDESRLTEYERAYEGAARATAPSRRQGSALAARPLGLWSYPEFRSLGHPLSPGRPAIEGPRHG